MRKICLFIPFLLIFIQPATAEAIEYGGIGYEYSYTQSGKAYTVLVTAPDGGTLTAAGDVSEQTLDGDLGLSEADTAALIDAILAAHYTLPRNVEALWLRLLLTVMLAAFGAVGVLQLVKPRTMAVWGLPAHKRAKKEGKWSAMVLSPIIGGILTLFAAAGFLWMVWS